MKKATLLSALILVSLFVCVSSAADNKKSERVKIVVKELDSEDPLPFASVCIVEKNKIISGQQTDFDGVCFFSVENKKRTIKISCVGYASSEMTIEKGSVNLVVRLKKGIMLTTCIINAKISPLLCTSITHCGMITRTECLSSIADEGSKKAETNTSNEQIDIIIYPNPTTGIIKIKSTFTNFSMDVFDMTGRLVFSAKEMNDEAEQNLDFLKPGSYLVRVSSGSEEKISRVVIE